MNNNLQNSFSSRKKIFITGIAGFIGFHLALKLKERGDHVEGCDNFNPYYDPELKKSRAAILDNAGIKVHNADIRDRSALDNIFRAAAFTHIAHLAAQAGVRYCITHPQAYVESNLDGFVQMLELARHFGPIPFIYASSLSVYGLNKKIPFSEEDPDRSTFQFLWSNEEEQRADCCLLPSSL
jgi:UDP-glucuronate 4-epimerase